MKLSYLNLLFIFALVSCNPQKTYNGIIESLGFIAYRTPLDSVGAGTIVKGQPKNLIVFTRPERCLPNALPDGTLTNLRFVAKTDLPSQVKESKFDFSADLSFFGTNGNTLFTLKPEASFVKTISAKFSDASIEFIDELAFWNYYKTHMDDACKNALNKHPIFWKALKVDKMEYVFRDSMGAAIKLDAPMLAMIMNLNLNVSWSIKNEHILTIDTPKYIGFMATLLTVEAIRDEGITIFSNRLDKKENYIWEPISASKSRGVQLPMFDVKPLIH